MNYRVHDDFEQTSEKFLPEIPKKAIEQLFAIASDNKNKKEKVKHAQEEPVYFPVYLNNAVNNIVQITGISKDDLEPEKVEKALNELPEEKLEQLAHFLWMFNMENPARDYKDWKKLTILLVKHIYKLRNFFVHPEKQKNTNALLADHETYVFLEGLLKEQAVNAVMKAGLRSDKIFKLKLLSEHMPSDVRASLPREQHIFEFTRKGLIFLTCLALYKDDAQEFCSLFWDIRKDALELEDDPAIPMKNLTAKAKSMVILFTYFSKRRGREYVDTADENFRNFADITGYLNKVPMESYRYLSLDEEKEKMAYLYDESTESEENKKDKYILHPRKKDRFLSFLAGYCEDFNVLPDLRFKRLDITPGPGRKKYLFGKEVDNRVRQDRHFVISKNAVHFEFIPEKHYGPVQIKSLRGKISESELKRLVFLCMPGPALQKETEHFVREYFTAYHRILETIVNSSELGAIRLTEQMAKDLSLISGVPAAEWKNDLTKLTKVLPQNIWRVFTDDAMKPDLLDLCDKLSNRLYNMEYHAGDFLKRAKKLTNWMRQEKEKRTKVPPVCGPEDELLAPPKECRISDNVRIAQVFKVFNLYLSDDSKFRQIPRGEQHRNCVDYEYQTLHARIGKYSLDQEGVRFFINKKRPELDGVMAQLKRKVDRLWEEEKNYLKKHPRLDRNRKPVRAARSLLMLAQAAAEMIVEECGKCRDKWDSLSDTQLLCFEKELYRECHRFGIKTGMALNREALIKSILRIDLEKWKHAYDYDAGHPYENRKLEDTGHIVSQIPFPNGMAERILVAGAEKKKGLFINRFFDEQGTFMFGPAILGCCKEAALLLRNYYDIKSLIAYQKANKTHKTDSAFHPGTPGILPPEPDYAPLYDYSVAGIQKTIAAVKNAWYQDLILVDIAIKYRNEFTKDFEKKGKIVKTSAAESVYSWFTQELERDFGKKKVLVRPHDLTRPVFQQIQKLASEIMANMEPQEKPYTFYDLMAQYRIIQAKDRRVRLKLIPVLLKMEAAVQIPVLSKTSEQETDAEFHDRKTLYEIRAYCKYFRAITEGEMLKIRKFRNKIMHDGFNLEPEAGEIEMLLRKTGIFA